jgi:hypothetical protein
MIILLASHEDGQLALLRARDVQQRLLAHRCRSLWLRWRYGSRRLFTISRVCPAFASEGEPNGQPYGDSETTQGENQIDKR